MSIEEKENIIFGRWKERRPNLIRDGVINTVEYSSSNPKLLFLLKEPNSNESNWTLIDFIKRGAQSSTWDNITRWIFGIRNLKKDIPWNDLSEVSSDQRKQLLNAVAVMNLKKTPGGGVTSEKELERFTSEDRDYLIDQFSLYNDHQSIQLTICCGSLVAWLFDLFVSYNQNKWESTFNGIPYREYQAGKFAIAYTHPEARVADNILYYPLIHAIKEILSKKGVQFG